MRGLLTLVLLQCSGCAMTTAEIRADGPLGARLIIEDCTNALRCAARQGGREIAAGLGVLGSSMANVLRDVPPARRHLRRARALFGVALGFTVPTAATIASGAIVGLSNGEAVLGINDRTQKASALLVSGVVLLAIDLLLASQADAELGRAVQTYNLEMVRQFEEHLVPLTMPQQSAVPSPAPPQ
jgi:hypothetical protein